MGRKNTLRCIELPKKKLLPFLIGALVGEEVKEFTIYAEKIEPSIEGLSLWIGENCIAEFAKWEYYLQLPEAKELQEKE